MRLLYILILSHLLADFVFQGKGLAQKKKESTTHLAGHSLVFLVCSLLLFFLLLPQNLSGKLILVLLSLTIAHFMLDFFKNRLDNLFPKRRLEWLTLDQFLHLAIILVACNFMYLIDWANLLPWLKARDSLDKILVILIGYVLMWAGTHFVRRLLDKVPQSKEGPAEFNVGLIIGNLERILIFTLVLLNQYAAIGFVLTAKSIARFEDLKKRQFAEYYLIGTLISSLIAIGTGIIVKFII